MPAREEGIAWHAFDRATLLDRLRSDPVGLSDEDAARRLEEFGPNQLPERPPPSSLVLFLTQFRSPLIYVLLIAAAISLAVGDVTDAVFILIVVLVNAAVGTLLEWKAERSVMALHTRLTTSATVLRSGRTDEVPAEDLVPGDVILLEPGRRQTAGRKRVYIRRHAD